MTTVSEKSIGLGDCEEGDIISFEADGERYTLLSLSQEAPDDPTYWVWRAVLVSSKTATPAGLDREIHDPREAYVLRFTDPGVPQVRVHGNAMETDSDSAHNDQ